MSSTEGGVGSDRTVSVEVHRRSYKTVGGNRVFVVGIVCYVSPKSDKFTLSLVLYSGVGPEEIQ